MNHKFFVLFILTSWFFDRKLSERLSSAYCNSDYWMLRMILKAHKVIGAWPLKLSNCAILALERSMYKLEKQEEWKLLDHIALIHVQVGYHAYRSAWQHTVSSNKCQASTLIPQLPITNSEVNGPSQLIKLWQMSPKCQSQDRDNKWTTKTIKE